MHHLLGAVFPGRPWALAEASQRIGANHPERLVTSTSASLIISLKDSFALRGLAWQPLSAAQLVGTAAFNSRSSRLLRYGGAIARSQRMITRPRWHGAVSASLHAASHRSDEMGCEIMRAGDESHRRTKAESRRSPGEIQAGNCRFAGTCEYWVPAVAWLYAPEAPPAGNLGARCQCGSRCRRSRDRP